MENEDFAASFLGERCWSSQKRERYGLTSAAGTEDVVFTFKSSVPLGDIYLFGLRSLWLHHFSRNKSAALQGNFPVTVIFLIMYPAIHPMDPEKNKVIFCPVFHTPKEGWEISVRGVGPQKEMILHTKAKKSASSSVSKFTFLPLDGKISKSQEPNLKMQRLKNKQSSFGEYSVIR